MCNSLILFVIPDFNQVGVETTPQVATLTLGKDQAE
jgi:hypothetical protein